MFIGSINQHLRSILKDMAKGWKGKAVYVGCSGNFTVERILAKEGIEEIYGNDVSLYSCTVGNHLAGRDTEIGIQREGFEWLNEYLKSPLDKISTLLLCSAYFEFIDRGTPYHLRMKNHYEANFRTLHEQTRVKVGKALEGISLKEFYPMDVMEYAEGVVPDGAVFISFPPTYDGGCVKLYQKIDSVFEWEKPVYHVFNAGSFNEFTELMKQKTTWVTLRDHPVQEMEESLKGIVQSGMRSKPVYVYSNQGKPRVVFPRQKFEIQKAPLLIGKPIAPPLKVCEITEAHANAIKASFLSARIKPTPCSPCLAVYTQDGIFGVLGFSRYLRIEFNSVYMMLDFVTPNKIRLSKLLLAIVLSEEVKTFLENKMNRVIEKIFTTVITDKPVSMKYRGLFELLRHEKGSLKYCAKAGRWTLEEAYQWWMKNHSEK